MLVSQAKCNQNCNGSFAACECGLQVLLQIDANLPCDLGSDLKCVPVSVVLVQNTFSLLVSEMKCNQNYKLCLPHVNVCVLCDMNK